MTFMGDNWMDKDDLDLTAEDLHSMSELGSSVEISGPRLPYGATLVENVPTYGGYTVSRPAEEALSSSAA